MTIVSLAAGCGTPKPPSNPLAGWTVFPSRDPNRLDRAIRDDYQDYIKNLPPEGGSFIATISFFEDGIGQYAVSIERGIRGKYWYHILFYDQQKKRAKVVIYTLSGGYSS